MTHIAITASQTTVSGAKTRSKFKCDETEDETPNESQSHRSSAKTAKGQRKGANHFRVSRQTSRVPKGGDRHSVIRKGLNGRRPSDRFTDSSVDKTSFLRARDVDGSGTRGPIMPTAISPKSRQRHVAVSRRKCPTALRLQWAPIVPARVGHACMGISCLPRILVLPRKVVVSAGHQTPRRIGLRL